MALASCEDELLVGCRRLDRRLEEGLIVASVHEVGADEAGESEGAGDGGLSGLGHSQEQESDECDGDLNAS